jgi:hypothetical protein
MYPPESRRRLRLSLRALEIRVPEMPKHADLHHGQDAWDGEGLTGFVMGQGHTPEPALLHHQLAPLRRGFSLTE